MLSRPIRRVNRESFPPDHCFMIARRNVNHAFDRRVLPGAVRRNEIRSPFGRRDTLVDYACDCVRVASHSISFVLRSTRPIPLSKGF